MMASVTVMVASLSRIEYDFVARVLEQSKEDVVYQRLRQQVLDGTVRRYWLENDLLFAQGHRLYVPAGHLRHVLLRQVHDAK